MKEACEVCGRARASSKKRASVRSLRRLLVGERVLVLCESHAERVREFGADTVEDARALFPEKSGRRSLVMRRAPLDRRMFPARPEGRRRKGRRATDAD